ncbi:hypothetical protein BGX27_010517 [Mortierella sp. AM989]|nr:hypothetical protein BGX27_010517 [Mortierella sp. AM989]
MNESIGDTQLPTISSIDLRAPSWDWQRVQLTQTTSRDSGGSGDNGLNPIPTSPSDGSNSNSGTKGLSTGIIAAIVAIVVLLLGLGFFCWRRRNTKKSRSNVREIEKAESASASNQGYPPVYEESQRANTSQPAPMPIYINPSTQQAGSWRAQPNKEELSEYGQPNSGQQQPQVSGSWSAASVPTADRSYNHIYQQSHSVYPPSQAGHAPAIATTTTNNATGQYANTPTSSMSSNTFAGDKHELTAEDLMRPGSAASNPFLSPRLPNSPAQSPAIGHVSPNGLHTREMLSPGLTNAQLILQQSQKPQH